MIKYTRAKISELASIAGKRLSICGIGIGRPISHDFGIVKAMLEEASEYECPVVFVKSCISSKQLSTAFSVVTKATTTTKTHISELDSDEILREFRKQPLKDVGLGHLTDTWKTLDFIRRYDYEKERSHRSIVRTRWVNGQGWVSYPSSEVFFHPEAVGVAFETRWFGEGRERLVKEFREIDRNMRFVGPCYVAKDSISVRRDGRGQESKDFHKKFLKSHIDAQEAADKFNELSPLCSVQTDIPTIQFLECSVYMLTFENGTREGFLVEPMIDFRNYQKFNDNQGGLMHTHASGRRNFNGIGKLSTIYEDDDEDSIGSDDNDETDIPVGQIPQAFSCFSCYYFYGKRLVCDLQGIYDKSLSLYRLTDPVIHSRRYKCSTSCSNEKYGRTDRGGQGISDFRRTHQCSPLCFELRSLLREERHGTKKRNRHDMELPNGN